MKYDCSKAIDYLHEWTRMCHSVSRCCCGCPLEPLMPCGITYITQEHIDTVQKWSDEHPEMPKLSKREYEFLKTFIVLTDKAISRGKLINDLYVHDARCDTYYGIDPTMFSFIREEERMTFDELLKLEVEDER